MCWSGAEEVKVKDHATRPNILWRPYRTGHELIQSKFVRLIFKIGSNGVRCYVVFHSGYISSVSAIVEVRAICARSTTVEAGRLSQRKEPYWKDITKIPTWSQSRSAIAFKWVGEWVSGWVGEWVSGRTGGRSERAREGGRGGREGGKEGGRERGRDRASQQPASGCGRACLLTCLHTSLYVPACMDNTTL